MITRERLEELIKQEAEIYESNIGVRKIVLLKSLNPKVMIHEVENFEYLQICNKDFYYSYMRLALDTLFETQEEAEFALRYQNIPRTEKLSLPMFEELTDEYGHFFDFKNFLGFISSDKYIVVNKYEEQDIIRLMKKPLTKENYLEACELCRKLFLGEKVVEE